MRIKQKKETLGMRLFGTNHTAEKNTHDDSLAVTALGAKKMISVQKKKIGNYQDKFDESDSLSQSFDNSNKSDDDQIIDGKKVDSLQKLSLRGKNLTSLDFLSKFMAINPNIGEIDIGDNPLSDQELQKFSLDVQENQ